MLLPKGNQNQNQNGELTGEENSPTAPAVDNFIYISVIQVSFITDMGRARQCF